VWGGGWEEAIKPDIQFGFLINWSTTLGLGAGIVSGQSVFNPTDKPLFIEALILTICFKPSGFKCALLLTKRKACLKSL
jgi:hypothetical protein